MQVSTTVRLPPLALAEHCHLRLTTDFANFEAVPAQLGGPGQQREHTSDRFAGSLEVQGEMLGFPTATPMPSV
ncbi:hypothetical protein D3C87_1281040 [compost metagenome]